MPSVITRFAVDSVIKMSLQIISTFDSLNINNRKNKQNFLIEIFSVCKSLSSPFTFCHFFTRILKVTDGSLYRYGLIGINRSATIS